MKKLFYAFVFLVAAAAVSWGVVSYHFTQREKHEAVLRELKEKEEAVANIAKQERNSAVQTIKIQVQFSGYFTTDIGRDRFSDDYFKDISRGPIEEIVEALDSGRVKPSEFSSEIDTLVNRYRGLTKHVRAHYPNKAKWADEIDAATDKLAKFKTR